MPRISLDTAEADVVARLKIFHEEITGVAYAYETPPSEAIPEANLPAVYFLVGGMDESVPQQNAGNFVLTRTYYARLLLAPFQAVGMDYNAQGAYVNRLALPFYGRFRRKYMEGNRFQTEGVHQAALSNLSGMRTGVIFRDGGLRPFPAPGGTQYAGIQWDLTIALHFYLEDESWFT